MTDDAGKRCVVEDTYPCLARMWRERYLYFEYSDITFAICSTALFVREQCP